jgi:hypothetical protein
MRSVDAERPAAGQQTNAGRLGGSKRRVQDLAGTSAVREQFAVMLRAEWNVELTENIDGILGGEASKDASDD